IAHEVRNPLASIGLYARMLSEDLGDRPQTRDLAEKIRMAVRGLDGVVSDVLSFARTLKVRRHLAGAEDIFGRALVSVASLLETKKIEIRQEIDPDLPAVPHDPELLHQALVNLLRNAAEAMSDGGLLVLAATADGQSVQMAVRDSGPGIPEEAVDRIFNPFFTTRATGTGLGLAIVHRIVDVHGGSITVHNDRGGGATFTVHLPLSAGPADADQPSLGATQA
ncbi:MAG: ATP-binding protein, partial [Phycisphaerae bacterium]|nr:ATP-binding protein [Phycisphaerae bacterium]